MEIPFDDHKELSGQDRNKAVAAAMVKYGKPSIVALGQVLLDTGKEIANVSRKTVRRHGHCIVIL